MAGCAGRPPGSRIGIGRPWRENLLPRFYRRTASNDLQLSAKRATVTRPFSQYSAGLRRVEILTEHQPPSRSMVFAEGGREVNRPLGACRRNHDRSKKWDRRPTADAFYQRFRGAYRRNRRGCRMDATPDAPVWHSSDTLLVNEETET